MYFFMSAPDDFVDWPDLKGRCPEDNLVQSPALHLKTAMKISTSLQAWSLETKRAEKCRKVMRRTIGQYTWCQTERG